ncbi:MAG: hypothetical protein UZ14_CFX002002784 [Chloroflexi bacterium OLB14]|nr:MAG: hypothetical protein UZ14_CFX002002784 [Chloroflexi bacterium OLB14]
MKNFRDIENLSALLDEQLNESESKRLKARLESDRELDSVSNDLSFVRNLLHLLPKRKSPKNFTLTRQMVGLKPPLPKTYPFFRLATVFATLLFVFTFSVNALSPFVSFNAPQFSFGIGGGGGGAGAPAVQEAPATEEALMQESAPAEAMPESTEVTRIAAEETPTQKEIETPSQDSVDGYQNQPQVENEALFSSNLIFTFLIISILGAISMFVIRQNAKRKWQ